MKLKSLYIIPMMLPLAHASLPDEVNYEPYQLQYERLSAQADTITANLERAEAELQSAYNRESDINNTIRDIQESSLRLNSQIQNHLEERSLLTRRADEISVAIDKLQTGLSRALSRQDRLEQERRSENRKLEPLRQRLRNVESRLSSANQEVKNARKGLNNATQAKNKLKNQVERQRARAQELQSQIDAKAAELASIEKNITKVERRISNLKRNLRGANGKVKTLEREVVSLNRELTKLEVELKDILAETEVGTNTRRDPRVAELRRKIRQKKTEIKTKQGQVANAKTKVTELSSKLSQAKRRLAELKRSKESLPREIAAKQRQLNNTNTRIQQTEVALRNAKKDIVAKEKVLNEKVRVAQRLTQNKVQVKQQLADQSVVINEVVARLSRVNNRVSNLQGSLRQQERELNTTQRQLDVILRQLPELRRSLADNRADLNRLDIELVTTQNRIISLSEDVDQVRSEQINAIVQRDKKYEEYISRLDYYNEKLAEAKTLGASQTDAALSIGRQDGNLYVANRADSLGKDLGNQLAEAQGSYWSNIRAEISGYAEGYAEGYASSADETRGEREGSAAGKTAANNYANTTLKPQFFNEIFARKLKTKSLNFSSLATASVKERLEVETQILELNDVLVGVSPITPIEVDESLSITTSLDGQISTFRKNLSEVIAQKNATSVPRNAYQSPTEVPFKTFDCSSIYKGITEFKVACEKQYYNVFESRYKSEYFSTFAAQYTGLFEAKVEDVRAQSIANVYNMTFEQAFPVAKASGISSGKNEIYKEAYAQAYEVGYQAQIPTATSNAQANASIEVNQYIASNATLTLKGASIEGAGIVGGSTANVNLVIKNISPKDLTSPVMVRIKDSKNIILTQREFSIQTARGNSTTDFKGITFQVDPRVVSNQKISLQGEVILKGGKYQARRVETFSASTLTDVNPAINEELSYDSTPQIRTTFRRRTLVHNLDIDISASIEDLQDGYLVSLSAVNGSESLINFKNTTAGTGALSTSRTKQVRFKYFFPIAADGKTVQIKADFIYKGKIMKSQIISLRPH